MINNYLEKKIKNYDKYKILIVFALIFCSFLAGKLLFFSGIKGFFVGILLGVLGGVVIFSFEFFINKQNPYKKGLYLEEKIAEKLEKLNIEYDPHIETSYGDLDFLIIKGEIQYGVEAKNWAGEVVFENGLLKVSNFDRTNILNKLLNRCRLVKNSEFGESSDKYINPMLVFGYKAIVNIPQNKIIFNGKEIIIATVKDFEKFIK